MSTVVTEETMLSIHQILGAGATQALEQEGLPVPENELEAKAFEAGFLARTGKSEYLVASRTRRTLPASIPPWQFARSDRIFRLQGKGWCDVMAELCPLDLRRMEAEDWLMTTMAGVDVWLFASPDSEGGVLIGCDPSLGEYLKTTLYEVVAEHEQSVNQVRGVGQ